MVFRWVYHGRVTVLPPGPQVGFPCPQVGEFVASPQVEVQNAFSCFDHTVYRYLFLVYALLVVSYYVLIYYQSMVINYLL